MYRPFQRPSANALAPATVTGPQQGGAGGSFLSKLMGGRELRYNRLLDKLGSPSVLFKVPQEWGVDENNVILGLGSLAVAAGASATASINVPRDLVLRRLIIVNQKSSTDTDFVITAITIEGNSVALGGFSAGATFFPGCYWSPAFDLPVSGGTPVAVTIQNTSAAAATYVPTFTID